MDFDLIIIGGGIVGATAAYRAGQLGARTLLCDRRDAGRATDAGAGILAPESGTRYGRLWYDFALDAVDYYSVLIEDLTADGVPAAELSQAYSRCSMLTVALDESEAADLAEMEQEIYARQEERRPPPAERIQRISSAEARDAYYPSAGRRQRGPAPTGHPPSRRPSHERSSRARPPQPRRPHR